MGGDDSFADQIEVYPSKSNVNKRVIAFAAWNPSNGADRNEQGIVLRIRHESHYPNAYFNDFVLEGIPLTASPTTEPTRGPSKFPTIEPSKSPSTIPTIYPTPSPSRSPTDAPSTPTRVPSDLSTMTESSSYTPSAFPMQMTLQLLLTTKSALPSDSGSQQTSIFVTTDMTRAIAEETMPLTLYVVVLSVLLVLLLTVLFWIVKRGRVKRNREVTFKGGQRNNDVEIKRTTDALVDMNTADLKQMYNQQATL